MGQAVSVAVGRFVAVGEAIASENQELKDEMGQACFEARRAGKFLCLILCELQRNTFHVPLLVGMGPALILWLQMYVSNIHEGI